MKWRVRDKMAHSSFASTIRHSDSRRAPSVDILRRDKSGYCRHGWGSANSPRCIIATNGVYIMVRKLLMAVAAVAVVSAGAASTAQARMGFGGFHMGAGHFGSFHGGPMGFHHFHHRFLGHSFFVGSPYGYYDNCYVRVWTRWGWRLRYVCY
jgi:hypothetical protein